jgi:trehalose 6-phosphate synthase
MTLTDRNVNQQPLIVIVSNRGPFSFKHDDGEFHVVRGSGGLVTALGALAERHDVLWVASAMDRDDRVWAEEQGGQAKEVEGIHLRLIRPQKDSYQQHYNVISNPLLWFIQHQLWDVPRAPNITYDTWKAWEEGYQRINEQFAKVVTQSVKDVDRPVIVLPQDYQLYMVPYYLRRHLKRHVHIQPFVHIPWPGPDAWHVLPQVIRNAILSSLLVSDRVGFQTQKDAFNFVQTCRFYLDDAHSRGSRDSIHYHGRKIRAMTYPISIDVEKVQSIVEEPQTRLLKDQLINLVGDRKLILRVDRIEPSKNILRGLAAYRVFLDMYPEHRGNVQMLALLVPSRMEVGEYQDYLRDIMAEAGLINAQFSDPFWEPVRVIVGDNYPRAIAAMQLYKVLLVNPIADGMNLVAKEGVLVNQQDGVLLLSEHAGAFYELGEHVLTVSPFDIYGTAESLNMALKMPLEDRRKRADSLRNLVQKADVKEWFYAQADDALRDLNNQSKNDSTAGTPAIKKSA